MDKYLEHLIFGKQTEGKRIVSVEPADEHAEIFYEDEQGNVTSEFVKNAYWILFHEKPNRAHHEFKGNLHYKYGIKYTTRSDYSKARGYYKKNNVDIYSIYNAKENFLVRTGYTYFKGMKHTEPTILSFDIETNGLQMNASSEVYMITNTFRKNGVLTRKLFCFDEYEHQGAMIQAWCSWVRDMNPSIMCGHNIMTYDLPFLDCVASNHNVTLELGRDGSSLKFDPYESKFRKSQSEFLIYKKCGIFGRELVDTYFLALKKDVVEKRYETYGLKAIIKVEGLEDKDRVFYDASTIRHNIHKPEELIKIKEYAISDSDDGLKLYDLCIPPFFYLTQSVPKSFQEVIASASGSQINSILVRSYLQLNHSIPKADESMEFEGAISKGWPGIYKNILKADVSSLYPSIMLQYQVFNKNKDPLEHTMMLLDNMRKERLLNKKLAQETGEEKYQHLSDMAKIFINSIYGVMGTNGINFNDSASASKVTEIGRGILSTAMNWCTDRNFKLTSCDTDAVAFTKPDESEMSVEEQHALIEELNTNFPELIRFTHDGYSKAGLVFAAKNYVLYDGVKIKYKGSALKSSTLEPIFRTMIDDIVKCLLDGHKENIPNIYKDYVKQAHNVTKDNVKQWATKKTLTAAVYNSDRLNERKVLEAVKGAEYSPGDRVFLYYDLNENLKLIENFQEGGYNIPRLLGKLFKVVERFESVVDVSECVNYKLKKHQNDLRELITPYAGILLDTK